MPVLTLGNADLRVFRGGALLEDLHSCRGLPTTWRVERIEVVKTWPEPKLKTRGQTGPKVNGD